MRRAVLRLTLLDDVVLSERSATLGGHASLDYLPGATLLGAAAGRLYHRLDRQEAWIAFHSGRLRFGDGLPITPAGAVGLPRPICWHAPKDGRPIDEDHDRLRLREVWNLQRGPLPQDRPSEQLGEVHIARDGGIARPDRVLRMRTAIDKRSGIRRETALFGYQALRAGQRFLALLEADDDVPGPLLERVHEALLEAPLRLGRSRQSEYGGVRCETETMAGLEEELAPPPGPTLDAGELVLWLLADLALEDAQGRPLLAPSARDLHPSLPDAPLDGTGSFVRTRRYSPYNGYLRCHDVERPVITRGSVLRYQFDEEPDPGGLATGLGLHREAGLGRVWVNPDLLASRQPAVAMEGEVARLPRAAGPPPRRPAEGTYEGFLLSWLESQTAAHAGEASSERAARDWLEELEQLYRSGRELAGVLPGVPFGPGPSQWGQVLDLARAPAGTPADLRRRLFVELDGGRPICPPDDEAWTAEGIQDQGPLSFRAWLEGRIDGWQRTRPAWRGDLGLILGRVANEARRIAVEKTRRRRQPAEGEAP